MTGFRLKKLHTFKLKRMIFPEGRVRRAVQGPMKMHLQPIKLLWNVVTCPRVAASGTHVGRTLYAYFSAISVAALTGMAVSKSGKTGT